VQVQIFYGQIFSLPTLFYDLRDQKNKYMQDSATQTKGHAVQTLTEKTEIEDG